MTELGMGQGDGRGLGALVIGEFGFLIAVVIMAFSCLAASKWPRWLVVVPASLVFLSSPLLLQLQQFWINQGWQVGHVLNLFSYATWTLIASMLAIAFSPRV